ncbi:MAG: response regulator [Clostridiaceae bacterium]|nr:response regulator [Clostridiaceae bacterium]
MYNVMIVDDENILRQGLVKYLDWETLGFKIVAEAENGKDALVTALKVKPHIIFTDVYMPLMDGIEFADNIKKLLPETIVIILSGYNEFTYAQKAIEIGIFRYLIKPIKKDELLSVLKECIEELLHVQLEKEKLEKLKDVIKDNLLVLKERFFLNLVRGNYKENEISSKAEYLNLSLVANNYYCMIFSLDDYFNIVENKDEEEINLLKVAVQHITTELFIDIESSFFMFEAKSQEIGVIVCSNSQNPTSLFPRFQHLQEEIRKYFKTTMSIGIGRSYTDICSCKTSYKEAGEALEYRTAFGKNSIIFIADIKSADKFVPSMDYYEAIKELVNLVKDCDKDLSIKNIESMFDNIIKDKVIKKEDINLLVVEIICKLSRVVMEFGGNSAEVYGDKFARMTILNFDIIQDIRFKLIEYINITIDFINSKRSAISRNFIEKTKQFIYDNYNLCELNLNLIAENVHISPAYLSQLFKQVSGESCVDFITKIRINEAKKLLKETTLKTYEVAEKVGYNDAQYFSTCFKKIIGTSPTGYKNMIHQDLF